MKVLNLYAGLGGNRKLWRDVEVTAVEIEPILAAAYKELYPHDEVIVGDAHEYLLKNFKKFDFIWSSPPCPTHGQLRYRTRVLGNTSEPVYPDMRLYQEIILLKYHFDGLWVVENVESYYEPLIRPQRVGRHFVWSNFSIPSCEFNYPNVAKATGKELAKAYGIITKVPDLRLALRNCTLPEVGKYILDCGIGKQVQARLEVEV